VIFQIAVALVLIYSTLKLMKKILILAAGFVVVLVIGLVVAGMLLLDSAVKKGVETAGPMFTKVDFQLDKVSISPLSGSGKIHGFVMGNPEGYKTAESIRVGSASLALQPSSVFADKVVIRSIKVEAPEITYETNLKQSNLTKILENVDAAMGGTSSDPSAPSKKLQVDDFLVSGGKLKVSLTTLAGQTVTVPLPEIHFSNLGQGPEGITSAELMRLVIKEIEKVAANVSADALSDLAKKATETLTKEATKAAADAAGKVTQGIGDLFKKK